MGKTRRIINEVPPPPNLSFGQTISVPLHPGNITLTGGVDSSSINYTIINSTEQNEFEGFVVRLSRWNVTEFVFIAEDINTVGGSGYSESGFFGSLVNGALYKVSAFTDDACSLAQLSRESADGYFQSS